jgi:hypothetical protein
MLLSSVISRVIPKDFEWKHSSVVLKVLVEVFIRSSSFKFNLKVLLMFSHIWRILFHIDHLSGMNKWVFRVVLWWVHRDTTVSIKLSSKVVTTNDSEDSSINIKIHRHIQISPVEYIAWSIWIRHFVSLEEHSLRNSWILNSWLSNEDSVIV